MSNAKFLELEIALLLASFGQEALLDAVARKVSMSSRELEEFVSGIDTMGSTTTIRKPVKRSSSRQTLDIKRMSYTREVDELLTRFENRAFLPTLREVQRFLDVHMTRPQIVKSRVKALAIVGSVLSQLDDGEIRALLNVEQDDTDSALSLITNAILKKA